jgi:hypothetical protein
MLKIAGVVLAIVVAAIILLVAWLYYRAVAGGRRAYKALADRIAPVTNALVKGEVPSEDLLRRFAADRETRKVLFETLESFDRIGLFPAEFLTWELLAEADLVAWLAHPNELGSVPPEIELLARVPEPGNASADAAYFIFRFRVHEPHWAAKNGWLAGVAGPYSTSGTPTAGGRGTFSRFEPAERHTPEEHVALAHQAVFGGGAPR